ncbi:conserved exported hypothetical protein [uncultured Stenotrophomonas sp.]|uniref:Choline dehydrogenase n=1 Tax=uncultured Stenotrophomonas sp. TaxID=165438 RepID=A0A1Y5PYW3_9GAMM|nr:conserved exported hypothetical protein [uncultured Stenotrophomonas sp.]
MTKPSSCALTVALALALAAPGTVHAADGWSGDLALTSRYVSRGFVQSWDKPAVQGGVQYDRRGFFLGTWASTVSKYFIEDAKVEWDLYAGYAGEAGSLRYTGSLNYYQYPGAEMSATGTRYDYGEVIIGAGTGPVDVSYAVTFTRDYFGYNSATLGTGVDKHSRGSGYLSVDAAFPLGEQFSLGLHAGKQSVRNFNEANWKDAKVSLDTTLAGFGWSLAWTRGWDKHGYYRNYSTGVPDGAGRVHVSDPIKSRVTLTVNRAF